MRNSFKTVDEFYEAVEELISVLSANGGETEASRLDVILHGVWTTGSELIGELMLALGDVKQDFPRDIGKLKDDCYYFAKHHRQILGLK